jgi:hypothetical protein
MRPLGSGARRNRWGAAVRPKRPPRVTRSLSGSESSPMPPTDVTISSPDARNRPSSQPRSRSIAARAHVDQSVHPRLLRPRGPGHDVQWPPRERDKAMMLRSAIRSSMRPSIPPTRRRQQHMHRRVAPPSPGTSSRRLVDSSNRRIVDGTWLNRAVRDCHTWLDLPQRPLGDPTIGNAAFRSVRSNRRCGSAMIAVRSD